MTQPIVAVKEREEYCPIDGLLEKLMAQQDQKRDLVIPVADLHFTGSDKKVHVSPRGAEWREEVKEFSVLSPHAVKQLCAFLNPKLTHTRYIDELAGHNPAALADLINSTRNGTTLLFRMLDDKVRSVHSRKYKCIDHLDTVMPLLQTLKTNNGAIIRGSITEQKMEIVYTAPDIADELIEAWNSGERAGDHNVRQFGKGGRGNIHYNTPDGEEAPEVIHPYGRFSNSEIGLGSCMHEVGIMSYWCWNGCIGGDRVRAIHRGERLDEGDYSRDTIRKGAEFHVSKIQDQINNVFNPEKFAVMVQQANDATNEDIENPVGAVDMLTDACNFTEAQKNGLLNHFLRDYKPTRMGLAQAIARTAQDVGADRAAEFERVAGELAFGKRKIEQPEPVAA